MAGSRAAAVDLGMSRDQEPNIESEIRNYVRYMHAHRRRHWLIGL